MRKDLLIGTIITTIDDEFLLIECIKEDNETISYRIATLDNVTLDRAVVLPKSAPYFEMETLHYHFRVHDILYPLHPSLREPGQRLHSLTAEMVEWVQEAQMCVRSQFYQFIYFWAVKRLMLNFHRRQRAKVPNPDFWTVVGDVTPLLDDELLRQIGIHRKDPTLSNVDSDFLQTFSKSLEKLISDKSANGMYFPIFQNPIYNLLGLYCADFINDKELDHIAAQPEFERLVERSHLEPIFQFLLVAARWILDIREFHRSEQDTVIDLNGRRKYLDDLRDPSFDERVTSDIAAATVGCRLAMRFATTERWEDATLVAQLGLLRKNLLRLDDLDIEDLEPGSLALNDKRIPPGRKTCAYCGGTYFDNKEQCPSCGRAQWWYG